MKKLAVVGSRSFFNFNFLESKILENYKIDDLDLIISGGAIGCDSLSQSFCKKYGLKILIIYPNWNKYGSQAGFIRNKLIVENCDELICFRIDKSKGCSHSVELAKKMNKKVWVYDF